MSEQVRKRFESVNEALPLLGDQVVASISAALREGVLIVLHVIIPSSGEVMMTTNMPEEALGEFMQQEADEFTDGNYTHDPKESLQ